MARESLGAAAAASNDLVRVADVPELAQDAVGTILTDSSTVDFTYDDSTPAITAAVIDDSIANSKLANMAQATFKMRAAGAGTGDPIDGTAAQAKTALAITASDISNFDEAAQDAVGGILASSGQIDFVYSDATPSITAGIANDAVTNARLANMAQATIKGRATGAGTGDPTDLTADQVLAILATGTANWSAYTTTWSTSGTQPAIGNGTLAAAFARVGNTIHFQIALTAGSTTTFGTNPWLFTMPVTALTGTYGVGSARLVDISTGNQYGRYVSMNSTTQVFMLGEAASSFVTATVPFTWANGDLLTLTGTYRAA